MNRFSQIACDGIWRQNPVLVQLLGLCPLLAVSTSFVTAFSLGVITLFVLTASNIVISIIRLLLHDAMRMPTQIIVIATFVTLSDIVLQAWYFELHHRIGLFLALIFTNCTLLGRAEIFTTRNHIANSALDGFMMGLGFLWVLVLMGSIRETLGSGTLFSNMHLLLGPIGENLEITFSTKGFLLLVLPPGAFITLGLLIASKNYLFNNQE